MNLSMSDLVIRKAVPDDAGDLAPLVNRAGEGLPMLLWQRLAEPGQSALDVGQARVAGTEAGISHLNTWVAEVYAEVAGCLIAYSQPSAPTPIDESTPALFRPLLELENDALDTGYVYVLSAKPEHRGKGVGTALLAHAETQYRGPRGMSLIVSDGNPNALCLYRQVGFVRRRSGPMVNTGWDNPGENWILMIKP